MAVAARLKPGESLAGRILKVDHAGEHGAVNIYRGQIFACRIRAPHLVSDLRQNQTHEERHRSTFAEALLARGVRRCRSYHLCGLGGFGLGIVTGFLGPSAVAATTVAVEDVVLRHLRAQLSELEDTDKSACATVMSILHDEQSHHDRAASQLHAGQFWPRILKPIVAASTELVIWMGMNL